MLVDMALDGKVDYPPIRALAQVFGMEPPATLEAVRQNLAADARAHAAGSRRWLQSVT